MSGVADLSERRDLRDACRSINALVAEMRGRHLEASPSAREHVALVLLAEACNRYIGITKIAREPLLRMLTLALAVAAATYRPADLNHALRLVLGDGAAPEALATGVAAVLESLPGELQRIERQYPQEGAPR